ncbi:peroxiredoxin [Pseudodonghicola flavimaris]|uniref:Peroxiredoxin n=1 Tax=Pseudodonghicola flavimaris TaxID=3050036 RepID=A0ABT7EWV6_9RHOB|nr:peroxiredoxin [Pseudodonghicola flavimaris]MDK3016824.1 peroxiredoxin [Pseudodonghicola flavimaris]
MTDAPQTPQMPRLNEAAPAFDAPTTDGRKTNADYKGKWLILFSHPADFTPVCTTEFIGFAKRQDDFAAMNTALLGLSIDSVHSHIAWMLNIKEKFGVEIKFPIIADLNMKVAQAYGMIQPGASDTAAVRATFIIDPEGVLRAMVYYPMNAGRSVDEIHRLLVALQTADENKCAMPENWKPGDQVIVPPPSTPEAAVARGGEGYNTVDWYFSTRAL